MVLVVSGALDEAQRFVYGWGDLVLAEVGEGAGLQLSEG